MSGCCHTTNDDGLVFWKYMLAGSVAGMVEHMAMFPVDTLKTRRQMLMAHPSTSRHHITSLLGLYRGITAAGLGAGPAHAVYFSVYEVCKGRLGSVGAGLHYHPLFDPLINPLVHATSGVVATTLSDAVATPMDVVKQRLQLRRSPYSGVRDCVARILKEEGFIKGFYASYWTTIVMNAPFTAVHFATYEAVKKALSDISPENASEDKVFVHVMAGGAAGALAGGVTTPLDVVKTRLQCQGVNGAEKFDSTSIWRALKQIVAKEGPQALLRGFTPRVLFHAPAASIAWSTYEAMKRFLHVPDSANSHQHAH